MSGPPRRPIKRLLIANRGEIATRILSTACELNLDTYALYTANDTSHTLDAKHTLELSSAASYLNIDELISLVKTNGIDAVHPGYGFLSESADFTRRMWDEAGAVVVGPGCEILEKTGDKLMARGLAEECHVPVLPALTSPTNDIAVIQRFATEAGFPIMVKAVDGGGGRGIRLIRDQDSLSGAVKRAIEESPSRQVFAERAAVDGFRHVEVQIVGDGRGNVRHLWERECSIQRRYQKVVEMAPSSFEDRHLVAEIVRAAVKMASNINYLSLGTFEFLASPDTKTFYFLEVNPRLQVEHTVTESISHLDLVRVQLLLAQGADLDELGVVIALNEAARPPPLKSIQMRITAEDPKNKYSLSIGKVQSFRFPTGNGVRVDTHLISGVPSTISADFDSLVAKIIVTASTWEAVVAKAKRALANTQVVGVKTNLDMLRGIVSHPDFVGGKCDTQWLEQNHDMLLEHGIAQAPKHNQLALRAMQSASSSASTLSSSSVLFRKEDAWSLTLQPGGKTVNAANALPYHLQLTKVLRNDFPTSLSADILFTPPDSNPQPYTLHLSSTSASASATSSRHRQGSSSDPSHVVIPFSGNLVEVLVDEGDVVRKGDVVCVVKQMKMELEVRSAKAGLVTWVTEAEDGEDVGEGMLAAVIEEQSSERVAAKL
ncbi:hypothetical protein LTR66_004921 [Elasticomyces elasticus]|nr:hypothetical protein LTR66_004921 [Elasticomyces elasticus]